MSLTIKHLDKSRLASFGKWLRDSGGTCDIGGIEATCVVHLSHPDHPEPRAYYAKFYPDRDGRGRGMANEVAGYIFANRMGLCQPARAVVIELAGKNLDLSSLPSAHAWLKRAMKAHGSYHAFCTEALSGKTPVIHYGRAAEDAIRSDIMKWSQLPATIVFDDIIANIDRHLNNLIRLGPASYAVIDHGSLVKPGGDWCIEDLDNAGRFENRLIRSVFKPNNSIQPYANAIVLAAEQATKMLTGTVEAGLWMSQFVKNPEDGRAYNNFVQSRTIEAGRRFVKRLSLTG